MNISFISPRYELQQVIGQGNFGIVYKAKDRERKLIVALKVMKPISNFLQTENEIKILTKLQGGEGIPKLYNAFVGSNYYSMELLGACLYEHRSLSQSNFIIIAEQLLDRIEYIHSKSILHRDLKPHQLMLGGYKNRTIYIVDFGLSSQFETSSNSHVPFSEGRQFIGSFNYASLNTHLGFQQSRRDDLESYCYILAYFFTGNLP